MSRFEFNNCITTLNSIDVDDIGNFCLEAINEDEQLYYYLIFKTSLGTSSIVSYGPVVPDVLFLPKEYNVEFKRMLFKDTKIKKWINTWLNDYTKKITTARVISWEEAFKNFRDVQEYMEKYCDEVY